MTKLMALYGYTAQAAARASEQRADVLRELASRLRTQRSDGRSFFVGLTITAADIYWACFSNALAPCPRWALSAALQQRFRAQPSELKHTEDEAILLEHRDCMLREVLAPIDF